MIEFPEVILAHCIRSGWFGLNGLGINGDAIVPHSGQQSKIRWVAKFRRTHRRGRFFNDASEIGVGHSRNGWPALAITLGRVV